MILIIFQQLINDAKDRRLRSGNSIKSSRAKRVRFSTPPAYKNEEQTKENRTISEIVKSMDIHNSGYVTPLVWAWYEHTSPSLSIIDLLGNKILFTYSFHQIRNFQRKYYCNVSKKYLHLSRYAIGSETQVLRGESRSASRSWRTLWGKECRRDVPEGALTILSCLFLIQVHGEEH